MKMKATKKYWAAAAIFGAVCSMASTPAQAQEAAATTPVQKSASSTWSSIKENTSASYTMWITGPTLGQMDGQQGAGAGLTLNQFLSVGYKTGAKTKLSLTQYFTNQVRRDSEGKRNLAFFDPYITFSHSSLASSKKYHTNLSAYIRYYVPISHESADKVGGVRDQKNGKIRIKTGPSIKLADGLVSVAASTYFYKPFAGKVTDNQRDLYIWFYPSVSVNLHDKFQPYAAYSNLFEHFRHDGGRDFGSRWGKFSAKQSVEVGFNWQPFSGIDINPYIEMGAPSWEVKNADVGLAIQYSLL